MRRYNYSLAALFAAVILCASCLNTDDEYTLYDDAAVTAFSLSSAEMIVHTTSSTGDDSTYTTTTTTVADYPFTIDQYKGLIYNVDSLPCDIDATKILSSLSTKNSGTAILQSLERADSSVYFSSSDTIDFSEPRTLRVISTSGTYSRTYTITVNVHKESPDSFYWSRKADNALFASMSGLKAVTFGDYVIVFGSDGSNTTAYRTLQTDGNTWEEVGVAFGADAYKNVVVRSDSLFVLDGATLMASADGQTFTAINSNVPVDRLTGGCTRELYGMNAENRLMASDDGGLTWTEDSLEDDASLLPTEDLSGCYYDHVSSANTDYVLLVGNRSAADYPNDSTAMVWCKSVEKTAGGDKGAWMHIDFDSYNNEKLSRLDGLTVASYTADYVIGLGGAGIGACDKDAFSQFYVSDDNGLHWANDSTYVFPTDFDTTATTFALATDDYKYIWIVCGGSGQVWKGRANKVVIGD